MLGRWLLVPSQPKLAHQGGALVAFTPKRGRPQADPRDREVTQLRSARAESEQDTARR